MRIVTRLCYATPGSDRGVTVESRHTGALPTERASGVRVQRFPDDGWLAGRSPVDGNEAQENSQLLRSSLFVAVDGDFIDGTELEVR